ncbi:hypothetical protein AN958_10824 [Leucoagaricus sp. SymC.cos]|nr:hypothetical protein AN958_10824 [Leucoagaricus sp. SymC.cos]
MFANSYRGNGHTKYAYEMLHVIHNLNVVYPPKIHEIVLNNWLVNPSGKSNAFNELDLVQEHLNFWIKVFYKAHGSNASWEWLEHIAPYTDILRQLASGFHNLLGADQGTKHAEPDLSKDIQTLMDSLSKYDVYQIKMGCIIRGGVKPVPDVVSLGYENLTSPLNDYNWTFQELQKQHQCPPVTQAMVDSALKPGLPAAFKPDSEVDIRLSSPSPMSATDPLAIEPKDEDDEGGGGADNEDSEEVVPQVELEDIALDMDLADIDIPDDVSIDSDDGAEV